MKTKKETRGFARVFGTEYTPGASGTIYAQIFNDLGAPVNTSTVSLTLRKSDGTKILDGVTMTYIAGTNGLYKYDFTAPSEEGTYIADVSSVNPETYGSDEIHVAEAAAAAAARIKVSQGEWEESEL